ncbi:hypothetical protein BH10PAT4_BH10PAT4_3250 [soil metagenome]
MPKVTSEKVSTRLVALDYLRGFFIVVIIIDHLARWPSVLAFISGKALLWVTAAEGFVIISGLLVGYVRGYKNKSLSMKEVSKKLISRGLLLYVWSIIATVAYTAIIWYIPLMGGAPGIMIDKGEWFELLANTFTLNYTYVWVHFLAFYALFLVASPIAIWLLRSSKAWLVVALSLLLLVVGWQTHIDALQWQALFFIPSVAGYYLEPIKSKWQSLSKHTKNMLVRAAWGLTAITIVLSVVSTFYSSSFTDIADTINDGLFAKDTISIWRLMLAFMWFIGFVLLFQRFEKWIGKFFGWLLLPIGTRSLTAYILHGIAIVLISYFTIAVDNILVNTLLGIIAILIVWAILRIPLINKIIPR